MMQVLRLHIALCAAILLAFAAPLRAEDLPEYRLKVAFLYNFLQLTVWPASPAGAHNLCVAGPDPFGKEIDGLQGRSAGGRNIAVIRKAVGESLAGCHTVFVGAASIAALPRVLESARGQAMLIVADSPGAMHQGVMLNMNVADGKVSFEANLQAARGAGLDLSSKLLRLATEVRQ
jgi:YfiR/HmsC-like